MERNAEGSQVVVSTDKGDNLTFDEVLMTTPLGYLKRNTSMFQPELPERLLAGIDGVSVGHLEKVDFSPKCFQQELMTNNPGLYHIPLSFLGRPTKQQHRPKPFACRTRKSK